MGAGPVAGVAWAAKPSSCRQSRPWRLSPRLWTWQLTAENLLHVLLRFLVRRHPSILLHRARASIIGRQRQVLASTEAGELLLQVRDAAPDIGGDVVRVHPQILRRAGHELHRPDRASGRAGVRIEAALLPG